MTRRRLFIPWDTFGWQAVADFLNISRMTAIRYASRPDGDNPLPAYKRGGTIVARKDELLAWDERETGSGST